MPPIANDRYFWLTSEFLENILRSNLDDATAKVNDFALNDAVAKGENYGSQMIRVLVNYSVDDRLKNKTLVIKTTVTHNLNSELMDVLIDDVYGREFAFYRDLLPHFEKYQNLFDPNFKCAPKCYTVCEDPVYYVFEDLKEGGFRNIERHIGLNFNATAMVLRKLAKMHAINAMLHEDKPELFVNHRRPFIGSHNHEMIPVLTNVMRDCQQWCLDWPGYEHFHEKLKNFLNNFLAKMNETFDNSSDDSFKTLIHGDLWVNNIMYKFDETTTPIDVIMVDYQLGYYGSPVIDLTYLLYTSTANDVNECDWDRLLQIYHSELVETLALLKYPKKPPSLVDLQIQMLKRSGFAVVMAFCLIPPRHLASEDGDLETLMNDSDTVVKLRRELFNRPHVLERTQYLMNYFERKGFL